MGTPIYTPQNDPHEALIILNIHKWGKLFFQKKIAHQLRLPSAKVGSGSKLFLCFSPMVNF